MFPVVDVRVLIVVALIVPPSTLSPLIWSFASVSVPAERSNVFPLPTVMSVSVIVLFVKFWVPVKVTTVLSIVRVLPSLSIPFPAVICPAPENWENSIEFVPMFISSEVTTKPESAFVVPLSTKENEPDVTFVFELKSVALSQEPVLL